MANPIVHVDIPASDPAAAAKFYADLFGWSTEVDEKSNYWMFRGDGGPGGGFVGLDENTRPGNVLIYVGTDDIDATLNRAESLGGKAVMPRTEIPQVGWFAIMTDPTGNRVGLFTATGM